MSKTISISQLKNLLREENKKPKTERKMIKFLETEIEFLKKNKGGGMNIGQYIKEYERILRDEFYIINSYNHLTREEIESVTSFMRNKFGIEDKDLWTWCTLNDVNDPYLKLWYELLKRQ